MKSGLIYPLFIVSTVCGILKISLLSSASCAFFPSLFPLCKHLFTVSSLTPGGHTKSFLETSNSHSVVSASAVSVSPVGNAHSQAFSQTYRIRDGVWILGACVFHKSSRGSGCTLQSENHRFCVFPAPSPLSASTQQEARGREFIYLLSTHSTSTCWALAEDGAILC